ncbi:MAG TPA: (d)CMP kinase [Candidatus Competibacteraceae bacterium]|mgnify:CR=1 FL=1|nr:MAG: (d)CMP kinase [Candidatus Competibacteraceae bacterium]HOB60689.1 (d)CMP kinase [Candidatus Competibacteraceae bacterium]HQA24820.1 (d)CMP kinase [Candidatus Competibacteraceae bacterium]HQD55678.1 (d)CMP kinase [Candidatus Competibacteraceae bacterium]
MSGQPPVITVDGPSGVGKGTLCQWLATRLGFHLLDSGALYRLTALAALRQGLALEDENAVAAVAASLDVRFVARADCSPGILLADEEVGDRIRGEDCGAAASRVAALPAVRAALLQRQRDFRRSPGLVADGRDMGTVVFPAAELKLFLTASAAERARRRYKQLSEKGIDANLESLANEIAARDARDAERAVAPLKPAVDAQILDTTQLDIPEVCDWALKWAIRRLGLMENP